MTRSELFTAVRALLVRPNLSEDALTAGVTLVESEFNRELREHPRNLQRTKLVMPDTEPLTDIVPLPTDIAQMVTFMDASGASLTQKPATYQYKSDDEIGFIARGNCLQVHPFPSNFDTYFLDYIAFITPLTDTTTNWISTDFNDLYIYGMLKEMAMVTKNDQRFTLWQAEFLRRLEGVKQQGWSQNIAASPVRSV